jgi:pSer/pThr/pTyr-binding forkhead associated (FHA) protein
MRTPILYRGGVMAEWIISLQNRVIKRFLINEGDRLTIGRGSEADVRIDNTAISRLHSALALRNGIHFLEDLQSLNGTFLNGERIETETPITTEDIITIGKFGLLPAGGEDQALEVTSVASAMDLEDATIFVSPKSQSVKGSASGQQKKGKCRLTVIAGNASPMELVLDGRSSVKIGKDAASDIKIPGWLVASAQCFVINKDGRFVLVPQKSWIGTWLNGLHIRDPHPLRTGDVIGIRRVKIKYE